MFNLLDDPELAALAPPGEHYEPPADSESFDEDLAWITCKLVARTGGAFGILVRRVADEERAEVLARSAVPPELDGTSEVLQLAIEQQDQRARGHLDGAEISQAAVRGSAGAASFQTITLRFQPTERVTVRALVFRPEAWGPFDPFELVAARSLHPVLARYMRLWWLHRTAQRQIHALHAVLNLSDIGVILLNRRGELLFANTKAAGVLDARDGLKRSDGSITAVSERDCVQLQALMRHSLHRNIDCAATNREPAGVQVMALERRGDRRKLLVAVTNVRRTAIDLNDPALIVYVLDPHQDVRHLLAPVCGLYKLTAAETRLVYRLVGGLNVNEAAAAIGVQPQTARAYLKQVFSKTSTHRQADLVRVMLSSLLRTNAGVHLSLL